ncbi:MAG: tRNA (adenosine(37)-N6)-dimethylallyltransferase MiaA [candidate division KSB1 bacterium]|nr:tRNA (adenosine(37)-N6)-dimethylallyltransferase MiaA [candidate division KSB1 bacterium]MDZ7336019.1 tRNA (adenosine(37)-N6)-dimethylallyltransferase MiaA [candidate division KSB1 bacterium]MDZ7375888.1 tRNA (adenosine(37)-N6)-dimethylallyltransferase MiaA [candidate division KSB1 bacterium]MDZ7401578.1 tRNA (adenosine(37)-N6)-dimethylallyltransferase MiaA [candidate division KSB1 bacterium]
MKEKVLIIVGPTGVGKTSLSLELAERWRNAEIISADSRQVYRYLDIGTAKPTPQQRAKIPHHFIDIINPDEYYSAGRYGREARQRIEVLQSQGKSPIVVGGSGLYIRALVDGFFERQIYDQSIKARLKREMKEKGLAQLYQRLLQVDPIAAEKIHPNDHHRIIRALEVYELTGEPLSTFQAQASQRAEFEPVFIGLTRERNRLYQMIEQRVDEMLQQGLVAEVKHLISMGYHPQLNSLQTVGYREVFLYLDGHFDFDTMVKLIKQRTRNYAKRQLTWFRKDPRILWLDLDQFVDWKSICDAIERLLLQTGA